MSMIPRYRPAVGVAAWSSLLFGGESILQSARQSLLERLGVGAGFPFSIAAVALRDAIFAWFADVQRRRGAVTALMSAQVCPVVPLAALAAGLKVAFADISADSPTPGPVEIAAGSNADSACVVLAPLYGHMHAGWRTGGAASLAGREVLLDLAQGLGWGVPPELLACSSAVGFSFGIGKGLDTGGGALVSRQAITGANGQRGSLSQGALWKCIILRATMAAGIYTLLADAVGRAADAVLSGFKPEVRLLDLGVLAPFWVARAAAFEADLHLARRRAQELGEELGAHPALAHSAQCFSADATHLRQLVRLADAGRRDTVVAALRAHDVDCAPAGETPPWVYLAVDAARFPNTAQFCADAIRLPFLGRITEGEFTRLRRALGAALG